MIDLPEAQKRYKQPDYKRGSGMHETQKQLYNYIVIKEERFFKPFMHFFDFFRN